MPSKIPTRARPSDEDPLTKALAPPPDETEEEREVRLEAEREAKRVSDAIDEEINRQRIAEKKAPKPVRVLLLGQSESGKSTTLKNFQLINSPKAFHAERASWRAVIQLNVVRSIRLILDVMSEAQAHTYKASSPASLRNPSPDLDIQDKPLPHIDYPPLTPDHLKLKMRLAPLLQVEEVLIRRLSPSGSPNFDSAHLAPLTNLPYSERSKNPTKEVAVNSTTQWKGAFTRFITNTRSSLESDPAIDWDDPDDPGVVLHACAEDMDRLWGDTTVRKLLRLKQLRLEEMAGFFLDSLDRVTGLKYVPSDNDILRARLKTLGVSEHRFRLKAGNSVSHDWRIFDVGGQRSLRAAWAPFFESELDAIIFLAPINCFDQTLEEDDSVNRLEDSFSLWRATLKNTFLQNVNIVLFLNKCDILKAKLNSGIKLADHVTSFGERPNDFESASRYLQKKFAAIHKEYSPKTRSFYSHFTSVTDVKSTGKILADISDMVIRDNLKKSSLV